MSILPRQFKHTSLQTTLNDVRMYKLQTSNVLPLTKKKF